MINTAGQKIYELIFCRCSLTGGCSICNPAKKMNEEEFLIRLIDIDDDIEKDIDDFDDEEDSEDDSDDSIDISSDEDEEASL